MEVILPLNLDKSFKVSILHVCGGDPRDVTNTANAMAYSPRMWRWSLPPQHGKSMAVVFSTYVEVIPALNLLNLQYDGILHVCGGDP